MSTKKKGVKNLIGGKTSSPDHSNKSKKKYFLPSKICPTTSLLSKYKSKSISLQATEQLFRFTSSKPFGLPTGGNDGEAGADSKSPASGSLQQFCGVINVQKLPSR